MKILKPQIKVVDEKLYKKVYFVDLTGLKCLDAVCEIFHGKASVHDGQDEYTLTGTIYADDFINFGFKILPPKINLIKEQLSKEEPFYWEDARRFRRLILLLLGMILAAGMIYLIFVI